MHTYSTVEIFSVSTSVSEPEGVSALMLWHSSFHSPPPPPYLTPSLDISPHLNLHFHCPTTSLSLPPALSPSHPPVTLSYCVYVCVCVCVCVCVWGRWAMTWLSAAALGQSCAVVLGRTMETRVADLSGYHSALTCLSLSLSLSNPLSLRHTHICTHTFLSIHLSFMSFWAFFF